MQARPRPRVRGAGVPGRQRLRRGLGDAAPVPRGAAGLDLGGLGQCHEPRRAARAGADAACARGLLLRARAGRRRRRPAGRARERTAPALHRSRNPSDARTASGRRHGPVPAGIAAGAPRARGRVRCLLRLAPGRRGRPGVRHAAGRDRLCGPHRARPPPALARQRTDRGLARSSAGGRAPTMRGVYAPRNIQLARIFGIRIGVGVSWFFVLFLFIFAVTGPFHDMLGGSRTTAYLVAVASVLSFFASLVLHELGHALVARRSGLPVAGIDLWALGGITRAGEPRTPGMELRVALAGPAVTFAVIVVCVIAGRIATSGSHFLHAALASGGVHATPVLVWLSWVAAINGLVLIFNLIPAFPLDGARSPTRRSGGARATATAPRRRRAGWARASRSL